MLRLASWTAGTTAGEMPLLIEHKKAIFFGGGLFLFKWGKGSLCFQFAKPCLLNTATGSPAVGPVLKREQSAHKRKEEEFIFSFNLRGSVGVSRCREQLRRVFVMYWLLCRWLLLIVISISKTNILSKHTQTHHQQQKQQHFFIDFDLYAFKSNVDVAVSESVGPNRSSTAATHRHTQPPRSGTLSVTYVVQILTSASPFGTYFRRLQWADSRMLSAEQ